MLLTDYRLEYIGVYVLMLESVLVTILKVSYLELESVKAGLNYTQDT